LSNHYQEALEENLYEDAIEKGLSEEEAEQYVIDKLDELE
jgi:hypothetical protein